MSSIERQRRLLDKQRQREADERGEMAREQHTAFRLGVQRQRQQKRTRMTLGRRVDTALVEAQRLSDVSGVGLEQHVSTGKSESRPPPAVNGPLYGRSEDSVHGHFFRRIRLMLEALEREVDGCNQKPLEGELLHELPEQKDARLVRDFEGIPSQEVTFLDRSFGTKAAVERARLRMDRDPRLGRKKP